MQRVTPPEDWSDREGWDRYMRACLSEEETPTDTGITLRFAGFALANGGKVWFPGCGIDLAPFALASVGCDVCASDISMVAVERQRALATASPESVFRKWEERTRELQPTRGKLEAFHHDFAAEPPIGQFDVVINSRAFHGLSTAQMQSAASNFKVSLGSGGTLIVDTMNVQGTDRDAIEEPLIKAGFYIPFVESEKWYRAQLQATGIVYIMVLGNPMIPSWGQYPEDSFAEFMERDQKILASFHAEYQERRMAEESEVQAVLDNPSTFVAHMVYSTG